MSWFTSIGVDVGWPLVLYALFFVALVPLFAWRSKFPMSAGRKRWVTLLRMIAIALAVLSVAGLRFGYPTNDLAVGVVVDGTTGITPEERRQVSSDLQQLSATEPSIAWTAIHGSDDVEAQIGAAVGLMPQDRARRLIVATDGRDAHLPSAVESAHRAGVEVSILPIGAAPTIDRVAVSGIDAPRLVRAEETSDVVATVFASTDTPVTLEAFLDGHSLATTSIQATRGNSTARFSVRFPEEPGIHELEVAITTPDPVTQNNRWRTLIEVLPKPRVRIYHAPDSAPILATVLRDAGMDVEVVAPQAAFTETRAYEPFSLVIADEIELGDLSDAQQQTLRSWVEDEGGGLITTTFNRAVRSTPRILREIEPIRPPPAQPEPRPLELVLVIDRSSSMSGAPMEQARQAGIGAVGSLRRDARVGAVAFSGGADRVIAPVPMDRALEVTQFIAGIHAEGGTNIAAAISAANRVMSNDPNFIHHVILISDGESEPQSAMAAAMALAGRGVTITTITIGSFSPLLAEIARIGRGRYHVTNAAGLRSVVMSEAMMRQPPAHRQTPFAIRQETPLPMLDGIDFSGAPAVAGHALSGLRPGATQVLTATEGMPLLAHWHRGLGQVATWTSATSGSWTDGLRSSPVFRTFWTRLARGMLRSRTVDPPRIVITPDPLAAERRIVTVISPFTEDRIVPLVRLYRGATVANAQGVVPRALDRIDLTLRGPGVWQAEIETGFTFLIDARLPLDTEPTAAEGDERPYDPRIAAFGPDDARIARLATLGGGTVLTAPREVLGEVTEVPAMRSLRTPLLVLALLFYLVSLLLLRLPDRALATGFEVERASHLPKAPDPKKQKKAVFTDLPEPPHSDREAA